MEWVDKIPEILGYVAAIFSAAYGLALIIPGEQPDKFLKKVVDITERFSRKPKDK